MAKRERKDWGTFDNWVNSNGAIIGAIIVLIFGVSLVGAIIESIL